ncbi:uncharacterized protein LOC114327730 [Diabrotica virgifera virgifera]|uniref:SAP domain-containing protein n=1 Tax=Diabrotica virgifera virgifera TaxID=50390 RepID=A0ABM5IGH2_DIAVI|nr:uncharacterized protein LOC114327730 [Diabrotica virgifera virgifera]
MSSLCKLTIADLRLELEGTNLDSTGKNADLFERLKDTLKEEGHDLETYVFEDKHAALISSISKVSGEISQVSTDIMSLENKVCGEISQVSGEISKVSSDDVSKVSANITSLEHRVSSEILKVSGDISSLESKMTNEIS